MKKIDKIVITPNSTIREALQIIDSGAMRIALVVDADGTLLGTLTDGDIRRALLKGLELGDTIETVTFKAPMVCSVNDSREQILQKAVRHKIFQIPVVDPEGKVIGIEVVDELFRPAGRPNKVVLMVGGLGTRLRPLTEEKPKPLLEVGNKPILETIIENFAKYGFTNIILSVNYKAEMIERHFGDGSAFGVNIEYVRETKRMGTAGALSLIRERLNEPFFVMNGDLLTNVNFEHFINYHLQSGAMATMAVREYDFQVPYGVVNVEGLRVTSIVEKPVHSFFVSAGIYMLDPAALSYIPDNEFYDMPTLFETMINDTKNVQSFPIHEYWLDIGRMSDFQQANTEYEDVF